MSLALVYLARGIEGGVPAAKEFLDACRSYPAQCSHDLIVIAKGWPGSGPPGDLRRWVALSDGRLVELPDDGFDWGAYMRLTRELTHDWVCFLNTHSRPRKEGWLHLLMAAAKSRLINVGAVGATASWESQATIPPLHPASGQLNSHKARTLQLIRGTPRFVKNIGAFPAFPNPHLRSNAFMVRRELFLDFVATRQPPRCKRDSLKLESGRVGLTAFLRTRGLAAYVAGADGRVYGSRDWIDSCTFRVPGQTNLLVEDNQTRAYDNANRNMRRALERLAWGRALS
jgi:hypothetical protein